MAELKTKTSIVVSRELWNQFGAELLRVGLDRSQGLEGLIRTFLEQATAGTGRVFEKVQEKPVRPMPIFNSRNLRQHRLLETILESKTPGARDAITRNLRYLAFTTTVAGPKTDRQIDSDLDAMLDSQEAAQEPENKLIRTPKKRRSKS